MLAGIIASRRRLPALAIMRAPTAAPSMAVRLGAALPIWPSSRSSMRPRSSCRSPTCRARPCTASRSSSDISPPRLCPDTAASICTFASSNPAASKSFAPRPPRRPARTTFAYPATPSTRLPSSGKCSPYHSRMRRSSRFAILSTSSSDFIACMMCMSALPDASATLAADRASAKSRRRDIASAWSDANPDSTSTVGFDACTASASPASMAWQSSGAPRRSPASSPASLTAIPAPSRPDRYSTRPESLPRSPSLAARYSAAGSLKGKERACDAPSYTATPSSVSTTLCTAGRRGRPLKVMGRRRGCANGSRPRRGRCAAGASGARRARPAGACRLPPSPCRGSGIVPDQAPPRRGACPSPPRPSLAGRAARSARNDWKTRHPGGAVAARRAARCARRGAALRRRGPCNAPAHSSRPPPSPRARIYLDGPRRAA